MGQDTEIQYLVVVKHPIHMSNIVKNYQKVLEVINTLETPINQFVTAGRKVKMSDIEVVALSLTAEYMSIDSENSLFKQIENSSIMNLIERSQYNKRRRKLFDFAELVRLGEFSLRIGPLIPN